MIKLLLLTTLLTLNSLNADTSKMSEEELAKEFFKLDNQLKSFEKRKEKAKAKSEAVRRYGKTVDKLEKTVNHLEKTVNTLASTLDIEK